MKDEQIKRNLITTTNNVRKKYRMLKDNLLENNELLERNYKPILEPLKQLVEKQNYNDNNFYTKHIKTEIKKEEEEAENEEEENIDSQSDFEKDESNLTTYMNNTSAMDVDLNEKSESFLTDDTTNKQTIKFSPNQYISMILNHKPGLDSTYGVRFFDGDLLLGNSNIDFNEENSIVINNKTYSSTQGLLELLFKKIPNKKIYSEQDLQIYKEIGLETNLFRRKYDENSGINGTQSKKYLTIISKLIKSEKKNKKFKMGSSLKLGKNRNLFKGYGQKKIHKNEKMLMRLDSSTPSLTYWNDANELIDRLRLLISSSISGNGSHGNEIISIIDELKTEGLIN